MADRALTVTVGDRVVNASVSEDGTVGIDKAAPLRVEHGRQPGEWIVRSEDDERQQHAFAVTDRDTTWVFVEGAVFACTVEAAGAARGRTIHHHGSLTAPMPATVIAVTVQRGDKVTRGQTIVLLEAMKMELPLKAPGDGIVSAVHCQPGDLVQPNVSLVDLE